MGIGLFTLPFGVGYFTACVISNVDPRDGVRPRDGSISPRC
jgi:hypothetical protein